MKHNSPLPAAQTSRQYLRKLKSRLRSSYSTLKSVLAVTPPIYIFQMGKVGSSTLKSTLPEHYGGMVAYGHHSGWMNEIEKTVIRWRKKLRLPIYVICPIRDPLSRNISAFFQNFEHRLGYKTEEKKLETDDILNIYLDTFPHNESLEWFDKHLRNVFDVDVFSEPFCIEERWKIYRKGSVKVLVYRSDLKHSVQLDIISRFIHTDISQYEYDNISESKGYATTYKSFAGSVKLPDIYLSLICNSRFCRHFWSSEELDSIQARWRKADNFGKN